MRGLGADKQLPPGAAENRGEMLSPITFSGDASAPTGPPCPSAPELQGMGALGLELGRAGRVTLMNQIGMALGIPAGGWHGQARLFERDDIRLKDLFPMMARQKVAQLIAGNLERTAHYVHVSLMLVMVIAQREARRSLTATGTAAIQTYHQGGLDFLDKEKGQLGLPQAVTSAWGRAPSFVNAESNNEVFPEFIPARDQLLAYGATIAARFSHNFAASLRGELGAQAGQALTGASRQSLLVWQAYAFLASGGTRYTPDRPLGEQLGQKFGHRSALGYYAYRARREGRPPSLNDILTDRALERVEWVRSAKTRAAETLFLERLLKKARDVLRGIG